MAEMCLLQNVLYFYFVLTINLFRVVIFWCTSTSVLGPFGPFLRTELTEDRGD